MSKYSKRKRPVKIPWKYLLGIILALRVITLLGAILGLRFLSFKPSFPYADAVLEIHGSSLLWSWANFDGVHYLLLAEKGYAFGLTQAFFPLYFLLIRWGNILINNRLLVGLTVSHLSFIGAIWMFYKLTRLDFSEKTAKKTVLALVLFPTAFFFLSLYTESWFLFLLLSSFYLARKKEWIKAGLIGAIASASRIIGVFLIPALLYQWWKNKQKRNLSQLVGAVLPAGGLLAYMIYLQIKFGDPLMFAHVQEGFGAGRTTSGFILLYQVFWRYLKMIFTVDPANPIYFTVWLELLSAIFFLGLLAYAWRKGIRKSYLIFAVFAYLLPTLTGTFSSMPRYVLVLFPAFMVLGSIKNRYLYWAWITISILLLLITTMLFTRGYWVA